MGDSSGGEHATTRIPGVDGGRACPCCGAASLREPPGSFEICPRCGWEDDPLQARRPELAGGANRLSLDEARANWLLIGMANPLHPPDAGPSGSP
jgi:hypothetical protein